MERAKPLAGLGGRYDLGPALGSGGFGTVFRARDRRSGADVAIKLVLSGLGSEPAAERLRREGDILRKVVSRHVARVYDAGDDDSAVWLVTELVEGAPLAVATLGRPLLPHEVLRVARGLLEGLAAVHDAGILHGDVKPSNVLVPHGDTALDGAKLVDFGLARIASRMEVAASLGDPVSAEGSVLGSARYMAPEVLTGGEPTWRSDVYAAGLVLFELLDDGPLFHASDLRQQLRARVAMEPRLVGRVPEPLSGVLARMLALDPSDRYRNAREAYEAVVDLDTAPVSVVRTDSLSPGRLSIPPSRGTTAPSGEIATFMATASGDSGSLPMVTISGAPRPAAPSIARLTRLPEDAVIALRETLRALDLSMLDALARRERGSPIGRIVRAVALALRLELDAAALVLEPLAMQSDVARAIGASVLAPRARRTTRARVDADREDRWIETIDPELGAMLVGLAAALAASDDAVRDGGRCARALSRLEPLASTPGVEEARSSLLVARLAARARGGGIERLAALELVERLPRPSPLAAPFHTVVRALALASLHEAMVVAADLGRSERLAAETGTTLLDACTATVLGAVLATSSPLDERAVRALDRAGTLLAHGDAPSLENEVEHHRAILLVARGRYPEAIVHLHRAREAAHAERASELELRAIALETIVELAIGDMHAAYESVAVLGASRLAAASPPVAVLGWVARALAGWVASDRKAAEDALTSAEMRLRELDEWHSDPHVLVEVIGLMFDASRGALSDVAVAAAGLERLAETHGFVGFHWVPLLEAIAAHVAKGAAAPEFGVALERVARAIGPDSRLAHARRTEDGPAVFETSEAAG